MKVKKVVVVFHHPPKDQHADEFDCWALHCQFIHIMEKGEESALFDRWTGGGENVVMAIQVAETIANDMSESMETKDTDNNAPTEIAQLLERYTASRSVAINNEDVTLIHNIFPGMVDDNNQPLPENIPFIAEQEDANPPAFFGAWKRSGICYCCLNSGRKNMACLNFNNEVSPAIQ